jgi:hypothetical protein
MPVEIRAEEGAEEADMSAWAGPHTAKGQPQPTLERPTAFPAIDFAEALDFPSVARRRFRECRMGRIDQALARIDEETYGACLARGMAIPIAALRGEPFASECHVCVAAHRVDRARTA